MSKWDKILLQINSKEILPTYHVKIYKFFQLVLCIFFLHDIFKMILVH